MVTKIFRWCMIQEFQLEVARFNLINCVSVCVGGGTRVDMKRQRECMWVKTRQTRRERLCVCVGWDTSRDEEK
jgi:hypothetical protein